MGWIEAKVGNNSSDSEPLVVLSGLVWQMMSRGKMKRTKIVVTIDRVKSGDRRFLLIIVRWEYTKSNGIVRLYAEGIVAAIHV